MPVANLPSQVMTIKKSPFIDKYPLLGTENSPPLRTVLCLTKARGDGNLDQDQSQRKGEERLNAGSILKVESTVLTDKLE